MEYTEEEVQRVMNGETTWEELDAIKATQPAVIPPVTPQVGNNPRPAMGPEEQQLLKEFGPTPPLEGASRSDYAQQLKTRREQARVEKFGANPSKRREMIQNAVARGDDIDKYLSTTMYDGMTMEQAFELYGYLNQVHGGKETIPYPTRSKTNPEMATVGSSEVMIEGVKEGAFELAKLGAASLDQAGKTLFGTETDFLRSVSDWTGKGLDVSESSWDQVVKETAQIVPGFLLARGLMGKGKLNKKGKRSIGTRAGQFIGYEAGIAASSSPEMQIGFGKAFTDYMLGENSDVDPDVFKGFYTDKNGDPVSEDLLRAKMDIFLEGLVLGAVMEPTGMLGEKVFGIAKDSLYVPIKAIFSKSGQKSSVAKNAVQDLMEVLNNPGDHDPVEVMDEILTILDEGDYVKTIETEGLPRSDKDFLEVKLPEDFLDRLYRGYNERRKTLEVAEMTQDGGLDNAQQSAYDRYGKALDRIAQLKKGLEQQVSTGGLDLPAVDRVEQARMQTPINTMRDVTDQIQQSGNVSQIALDAFQKLNSGVELDEIALQSRMKDFNDNLFEGYDRGEVVDTLARSIMENKGGGLTDLNQENARKWAESIYNDYVADRARKNELWKGFMDQVGEEPLTPEMIDILRQDGDAIGIKFDAKTGEPTNMPQTYRDLHNKVQSINKVLNSGNVTVESLEKLRRIKNEINQGEIDRLAIDDPEIADLRDALMEDFREYTNRWYSGANTKAQGAGYVRELAEGRGAIGDVQELGAEAGDITLEPRAPSRPQVDIETTESIRGDIMGAHKKGSTDLIQRQLDNIRELGELTDMPEAELNAKVDAATERATDLIMGEVLQSVEYDLIKLYREGGDPTKILNKLTDTIGKLESDIGNFGGVRERLNTMRQALTNKQDNMMTMLTELDQIRERAKLAESGVYAQTLQKVLRNTDYGPQLHSGNSSEYLASLLSGPNAANDVANMLEAIQLANPRDANVARAGLQEAYLNTHIKNMIDNKGSLSIDKAEAFLQGDNGVGDILFEGDDKLRLDAMKEILNVAITPKAHRMKGEVSAHAPYSPAVVRATGSQSLNSVITLAFGILNRLATSIRIGGKIMTNRADPAGSATAIMEQFYSDPDFARKLIQAERNLVKTGDDPWFNQFIYKAMNANVRALASGENLNIDLPEISDIDVVIREEAARGDTRTAAPWNDYSPRERSPFDTFETYR